MLKKISFDKIKKKFPTYFAPDYNGQLNEDKIKQILNMYSSKEGGRTFIGKKLKVDQAVVGRVLKIAEKNNLIKRVLQSEFKTKESQRIYKDISERKIYKIVRPITSIDRKLNPNISINAKFKIQLPSGKHEPSTVMKYTTTEQAAENAKVARKKIWKKYL